MILELVAAYGIAQSASLNLVRGGEFGGGSSLRYWAVEDTFLDAAEPDRNFGGAYTLDAGPKRTILIRFGDLNRAIGPGQKIKRAAVLLTPAGGMPPVLKTVARLKAPFGEGPMQSLKKVLQAAPDPKALAARGSATWKNRRQGLDRWDRDGAIGGKDAENLLGIRLQVAGGGFAVEGLDAAFEDMRVHPEDNHGIALTFEAECQFYSSQSPNGRPVLRLELEPEETVDASKPQADLSVISITRADELAQPGSLVKYVALVKNLGKSAAPAFQASWQIGGNPVKSEPGPALGPGESASLEIQKPMPIAVLDPRFLTVALRVNPTTPEFNTVNNCLAVHERGRAIHVEVSNEVAAKLTAARNDRGSVILEDWAQSAIQVWNETVAPQSRFSFALEGALTRFRLQSVSVGPQSSVPAGVLRVSVIDRDDPLAELLRGLAEAGGARQLDYRLAGSKPVAFAGADPISTADRFGGLLGWGDTRYEGMLPTTQWLGNELGGNFTLDPNLIEPTDLLNGTVVADLNLNVPREVPAAPVEDLGLPRAALVRVLGSGGQPLVGAELKFFTSDGLGGFEPNPVATKTVRDDGTVVLAFAGPENIFGRLTQGRGVVLVSASREGETATTFLKAWQLINAARRGNSSAVLAELTVALASGPVDRGLDLAEGKSVRTSDGSNLAGLTSGPGGAVLSLASGAWVEVDLGRDRTILEIALQNLGGDGELEILAYGTGETEGQARRIVQERDVAWKLKHESVPVQDRTEVRYRPSGDRIRFLRLVNRGKSELKLSKWIVRTLKPTP